jgi:exopolyphosphatase/guanosine-5'-triphosphate,3'-diphosphate pyrophosphatase
MQLGLTEYSSEKVTGTVITAAQMQGIADKLSSMTVAEIAALPCMPTGRADVITGGAVLLCTLMQKLTIQALIVSDRDNLEGYAIKRGWMQ